MNRTLETLAASAILGFADEASLRAHLATNPRLRLVGRVVLTKAQRHEVIAIIATHETAEESDTARRAAIKRDKFARLDYVGAGNHKLTPDEKLIRRANLKGRKLGYSSAQIAALLSTLRREAGQNAAGDI